MTGHLLEMVTPDGRVDWTAGVVQATGIGMPPNNFSNKFQANELARVAAWNVALKNLLKMVKGISVDSATTISDYMTSDDLFRAKIEGLVKDARIVREEARPNGWFQVTVEMKTRGDLLNALLPSPKRESKPPRSSQEKRVLSDRETYTGLVLDARGIDARPALAPRMFTEKGEEVYSFAYLEKQTLAERGISVYTPDLPSAQAHPRVGDRPLVIKAIQSQGRYHTDLIIKTADAQTIHGVSQLLKDAKVLIILDSQR